MLLFIFSVRYGKDDGQHAHGTGDGHDDAGHRAGRDEDKSGKQHHGQHNADCAGLLRKGHPAAAVVTADINP